MMRIVMRRRRSIPSACTWRRRRAVRHVFFRRSRIRKGMIVLPAATAVHHVRCVVHFFGTWRRRAVVMHHHVVIWFATFSWRRISSPLDKTATENGHGHFGSHRRRERRRSHDMRRTAAAVWHKVLLLVHAFAVGVLLLVGMMVLLHHGNATQRYRGQRSRRIRYRAALGVILSLLTHVDGLERQWRRR